MNIFVLYLILTGLFFIGALGFSQSAFAVQVELPAQKDNTIFDEDGTKSCGACEGVFVGKTNNGDVRRGLIEFDVSSIPQGSTVTNVEFEFSVSKTSDSDSVIMDIHKVNDEWGEASSTTGGGNGAPAMPGDATWSHRMYSTTAWSTLGGDFAASPSVSVTLNAGTGIHTTTSNAEMVSDIQGWVDDANTNHGWILKLGDENSSQTARLIDSKTTSSGTAPLLRITYTEPDADSDGIPDNIDNCPNDFNTNQYDSDNDSIGDVCDILTSISQPIEIDDCHEFGGDVSVTGGALMTFTANGKAILPLGSSFSVSSTSGAYLTQGSSIHISDSVIC